MPDFNDKENTPLSPEELELLAMAEQEAQAAQEEGGPAWYEPGAGLEEENKTAGNNTPAADGRPRPENESDELSEIYALEPRSIKESDYKKARIFQLNARSTLELAKKIRAAKGDSIETTIKTYHERNGELIATEDGLELNGITIFSARTGGGKTMALVSFAAFLVTYGNQDIKRENVAIIFSLEEPYDSIYSRMLTAYGAYKGKMETDKSTRAAPLVPTSKEVYHEVANKYIPNRPDGTLYKDIKAAIANNAADMEPYVTIVSNDKLLTVAMQHGATNQTVYINALRDIVIGIKAYRQLFEAQGKQPLFFIDYTQLIKNETAGNMAVYKQIQDIMHTLMVESQLGAKIFLGAQSNRAAAGVGMSETNEKKEGKLSPIYAEVYRAISENMRESADIEQTADTIFYVALDKGHGEAIQQTLKHRSWQEKGIAAFSVIPNTSTIDYSTAMLPREAKDGSRINRKNGNKTQEAIKQELDEEQAIKDLLNKNKPKTRKTREPKNAK